MPYLKGLPQPGEVLAQEGTYILFLQLEKSQSICVGRYGTHNFPAGIYAYSGSAHGRGGLAARLKHHLAQPKKPHWHIDWVRPYMQWVGLYYETEPISTECTWSRRLHNFPGSQVVVPGFGASDCQRSCAAHFYRFNKNDFDPKAFIHSFNG